MSENRKVLSLMAHPDDAEFACAGTLALLNQKGWQIHIATMTPGDCGSAEFDAEKISSIRRKEAADSAKILQGTYHCLESKDVFIFYDEPTLLKVIELIRKIKPTIVFTHSPTDYHVDHENTSRLIWAGCFSAGMRNIEIPNVEPYEPVPFLYYADAFEGKDKLGREVKPSFLVDITGTIDTKEKMLCCHDSQQSWLLAHHGMDKYIDFMKNFAAQRGKTINTEFAEGFNQHLGNGFPQENILKAELSDLVKEIKE